VLAEIPLGAEAESAVISSTWRPLRCTCASLRKTISDLLLASFFLSNHLPLSRSPSLPPSLPSSLPNPSPPRFLPSPQAVILDRYPQIPLGAEAESVVIDMATPALRVCIAQRDDCPPQMADILQHAAKILRGIAATRD
ncbi:unnamed protein product, partial [Closterium sp. NIES-54]